MAVELVDKDTRLVLEYIATLQRQGHKPTFAEVEAYALAPKRRAPKTVDTYSANSVWDMMRYRTDPGEPCMAYLERVRWVNVRSGLVTLTPAALAMLRDLNSPALDAEVQSHVEVVVNPDDKMAYTRLLHQFNNLGNGLLVDPYLKLDQFLEIADSTPVTRILTSSKAFGTAQQRKVYQRALAAADGRIEVRHIGALHDRHYIPETGHMWMLGISLTGIAKKISVLTQLGAESSKALREAYEKYWADAEVLPPLAAENEPVETAGTVPETATK